MLRLFSAIDNLSGVPRRILLGGILPSLALLVTAVFLLFQNAASYESYILSKQMCETGVTLFSEGIVLGLFYDIFLKRIS